MKIKEKQNKREEKWKRTLFFLKGGKKKHLFFKIFVISCLLAEIRLNNKTLCVQDKLEVRDHAHTTYPVLHHFLTFSPVTNRSIYDDTHPLCHVFLLKNNNFLGDFRLKNGLI